MRVIELDTPTRIVDASAFCRLYAQIAPCEPVDRSVVEDWLATLIANPLVVVLVVVDDEDALIASACLYLQPRLYRDRGTSGAVEDFAVMPEHHSRGVGRCLLDALKRVARERGLYKLTLQCRPDVAAFYEACGYRSTQRAMGLYLVEQVDAVEATRAVPTQTGSASLQSSSRLDEA